MNQYQINSSKNDWDDVIYKTKNEFGQLLNLTFECEGYSNLIYWNVVFWIGKRKNGYEWNQQTGRDGLKSLLWAKSCIIDFINNVDHKNKINHLCIGWDDNRRKKTYMWGLKDLGFTLTRIERRLCLHKII